jgi:hypothetical protein
VVECLSNTCEALSSSSNTTKKMINWKQPRCPATGN